MAGHLYLTRPKNAASTIYFPLQDRGTEDFEATPVTFAAGDTKKIIDGAAAANCNNTPAHEGLGIYSLVLDAAELNGGTIVITLVDSATKAWEDFAVIIETYDVLPSPFSEISETAPTAVGTGPHTFEEMIQWLFRRWFNKHHLDRSTGILTVEQDDDATDLSTQNASDDGNTVTVDRAT